MATWVTWWSSDFYICGGEGRGHNCRSSLYLGIRKSREVEVRLSLCTHLPGLGHLRLKSLGQRPQGEMLFSWGEEQSLLVPRRRLQQGQQEPKRDQVVTSPSLIPPSHVSFQWRLALCSDKAWCSPSSVSQQGQMGWG